MLPFIKMKVLLNYPFEGDFRIFGFSMKYSSSYWGSIRTPPHLHALCCQGSWRRATNVGGDANWIVMLPGRSLRCTRRFWQQWCRIPVEHVEIDAWHVLEDWWPDLARFGITRDNADNGWNAVFVSYKSKHISGSTCSSNLCPFQAKSKTVLHLAELRRSWWWAALLEQFVDMGRAPWSYPVGGYWWNTVESYRIMSVNLMKFTEISQDTKQLLKGTPKQLPQVSINAPSTSDLLFTTVSAVASTDALHIFFIWGFP